MYADHSNPRIVAHGKLNYLDDTETFDRSGVSDRYGGFFRRDNDTPDDEQQITGVKYYKLTYI